MRQAPRVPAAPTDADAWQTPEGFILTRRLLLPDVRSFEELLTYHGEWDAPPSVRPRPLSRVLPGANRLSPYCTVDLSQLGGPAHRSLMATPTGIVLDVLCDRIVTDADELHVSIVGHAETNRALVIVQHGQIIGSHWVAYIDPATVPAYPYAQRDERVRVVHRDLRRQGRRPVVHSQPDGTIELHTTPLARTTIRVHADGRLTGHRLPTTRTAKPEAPLTLFDIPPESRRAGASTEDSDRRVRRRAISPAALEVLARCTVDDDAVFLPAALERPTYEAVNKALVALGAKWSRSRKAHVFPAGEPARQLLDAAISTRTTERELTGYFPTPPALARQLVALADVRAEHKVLEPSAGRGAIARLLATVVPEERLYLVELDGSHHQALERAGFHAPQLIHGDFLTTPDLPAPFDRIVMNPPFERQLDIKHVLHAWDLLAPAGRLTAIMSSAITYRTTKLADQLRELIAGCPDGNIAANAPDAFNESGAGVRTVTVTLTKP